MGIANSDILHGADLDLLYEDIFEHSHLYDGGGESVYDRNAILANGSATTNQRMNLVGFKCKRTETITKATLATGTTAAGATPTVIKYGLYLRRPDQLNYDLVAQTAHDAALLVAANTNYSKAFTAPYNKIRGEEYLFGLLIVSGAAFPTLLGPNNITLTPSANNMLVPPIRAGVIGSLTDLPATFLSSAVIFSSPMQSFQVLLQP